MGEHFTILIKTNMKKLAKEFAEMMATFAIAAVLVAGSTFGFLILSGNLVINFA